MSGSKVQPAPVKGFLERLQDGVVVGDGAMGTMLYARGVFVNRCFDELNLSNPALVEGGVDLFAIETIPALDQARAAVTAVRAVSALPITVSMTFTEEGTTFYGDTPEDVVRTLEDWDVSVVGANCSQGPQPMLET